MHTALAALTRLASAARDEPWKARRELARLMTQPLVVAALRLRGVQVGRGGAFYGHPLVRRFRGSQISLGDRVELRSWRDANPLGLATPVMLWTLAAEATITIGDDAGLSGAVLVAARGVSLGPACLVGAGVLIIDTDFHPLEPAQRRYRRQHIRSRPVRVGANVFIGARAILLKGTTIGPDSVVAAGSVVSGAFPAGALIGGNPARLLAVPYSRESPR